jgi:SOS-response transcriptional repressor LexA
MVEAAVADEGLRQAAAVNPEDKFELVFRNLLERLFVERMDQNEKIFVRFMNDESFQKIVTRWMGAEAYRRLQGAQQPGDSVLPAGTLPSRLRLVEGRPEERYVTCVPLVPLKAAAGGFGDPQHTEDGSWEWVTVDTRHHLRRGMFVAQVVGKSMDPTIRDGSYCLFGAPVTGTRQGKTVLVQLRDAVDPETGARYTVKRYESEKAKAGDSWRHARITLKPVNPDFAPIILSGTDEGQVRVIAEVVEVLGTPA